MKRPYLNKAGFNKLAQSIKDYINRKITGYDKLGTASTKNFTTYVSPTQTEQLPISSSVYSAMTNMLRGAYHPAGSKTVAELTEDLLVKANLGNVYKITEDGVTSDLFIGGAGQTIKTGDNAVVLYASEDTYKFSLESGVVDLDAYQKKELTSGALIEDVIPSDASASNKLVTKDSISTKVGPISGSGVTYRTFTCTVSDAFSGYQNHEFLLISREENVLINARIHVDGTLNVTACNINGEADNVTNIGYAFDNDTKTLTIGVTLATWAMTLSVVKLTYPNDVASTPVLATTLPTLTAVTIKRLVTAADLTSSVTSGSTEPITSGGVYNVTRQLVLRANVGSNTKVNFDVSSLNIQQYDVIKLSVYSYGPTIGYFEEYWKNEGNNRLTLAFAVVKKLQNVTITGTWNGTKLTSIIIDSNSSTAVTTVCAKLEVI